MTFVCSHEWGLGLSDCKKCSLIVTFGLYSHLSGSFRYSGLLPLHSSRSQPDMKLTPVVG